MGAEAINTKRLRSKNMKRIRCPKCENYLTFDETKYNIGQSLVFICPHCKKQFSIRLKAVSKEKEELPEKNWGSVTVIENVFGYKQVFPLKEGNNIIGRHSIGTEVDIAIKTSDMSMDRRHCILHVKRSKMNGKLVYTLMDAHSLTGTFLNNEIIGNKDRVYIEDGAVVTLGATTFILNTAK